MAADIEHRFAIEHDLRRGIPAGELRLFLQAQVDADSHLVGAEALVRWQHPERGLLPPGMFIGVAEESDLIVDLGAWVLSEACRLMARETMAGHPLRLSVNLSPRQFRQPGFVPWIRELLAATGADPTQLTLEVTEGLVIDNVDTVVAKMGELTALGIHFSVDDFGTGYSSLAYLKRMPVHELKIDKSFVQDAPLDPNDAAPWRATCTCRWSPRASRRRPRRTSSPPAPTASA
jgi:EAL domain-containing protein (putative c-di-GMP-specific phosphodiesterase class I)